LLGTIISLPQALGIDSSFTVMFAPQISIYVDYPAISRKFAVSDGTPKMAN
jgi:hypothetical protein